MYCKRMIKHAVCSLFLLIQLESPAQTVLPVYVMQNGSLNVNACQIVDPDSLRGNYPQTNMTLVLTGPAGSKLSAALDTLTLHSYNDRVTIYDGNSTSAPILISYTHLAPLTTQVLGSSNVLTIFFQVTAGNDIPTAKGWRIRIKPVSPVTGNMPAFLPVFESMGAYGQTDMADYDNDGDKDLIMRSTVFQNDASNDSAFLFRRIANPIGNWLNSRMTAMDFNADGLKDIFITGETNVTGTYKPTAALFRNNGNNSFTRVANSTFPDASRGACSVVDFNLDGKPDISYTGTTNGAPNSCIFKLFINNGNFSFTEQVTNLPGLVGSCIDWYDFDSDGDKDVLLNGYNTIAATTSFIYRNDGSGNFTSIDNVIAFNTSSGVVRWADIDGNGIIDIINTGVITPGGSNAITPEFLMNAGNGSFTRVITNLPARWSNSYDLFDYDGDGDLDIVYNGFMALSPDTDAAVYKNNGNGNFARVHIRPGEQSASLVKWVDINNDNRKDIFVCGRGSFSPSYVLKNMGNDSFRVVSYPFMTYQNAGGSGASVVADDLNNDGLPDFLFAGTIDDQNCEEGSLSALVISQSWRKTPFAKFKKVLEISTVPNIGSVTVNTSCTWGDVTNDGKPDIIVTGYGEPLRILRNDGNGSFTLVYNAKINLSKENARCAVIDVDNDGTNELYVIPNKLYKWNGNGFNTLYEQAGIACEGGILGPCSYQNLVIADFNKDGYRDVAFCEDQFLYVLRNNRAGQLVNDLPSYLITMGPGTINTEMHVFDVDADGDPDLVTSKMLIENLFPTGLRLRDKIIPEHGGLAFSDFNQDGYTDIFSNIRPVGYTSTRLYFNQQGSLYFQDITPANFIQTSGTSSSFPIDEASTQDIDNDGDDDIVYATFGQCTNTGVYINLFNEENDHLHVQGANGGETLVSGTTYTIKWTGRNLSNTVKIELTQNSGNTWTLISNAAASSAFSGEYNWSLNGLGTSANCRIRITDNVNGQLRDSSDRNFTINAATGIGNVVPVNQLKVFPNPGTGIFYCDTHNVPPGTRGRAEVIDMTGRVILRDSFITHSGGNLRLNIGASVQGVYIIRLTYPAAQSIAKVLKL